MTNQAAYDMEKRLYTQLQDYTIKLVNAFSFEFPNRTSLP